MADGVPITAGSGTTIATDDSGASGHVQLFKLAISADGSATLIPADATNGLDVDVRRLQPDGANTMPAMDAAARRGYVQITDGTNNASVSAAGSLFVGGGLAHDAADGGNPLKIGARARSTPIASVSSDDRTDAVATLQGYPVVHPFALPQSALSGTASSTGTGDTAIIAAQGAGVTINVTSIAIYNDSTTNTYVTIKDGATGRIVLPAPAKGGAVHSLPFPLRLTANQALNFASAAGVTTMFVSAVGFAGV